MGATSLVIVLVGLVIPVVLILTAIAVDIVILLVAAYRLWHDRMVPSLVRVAIVQVEHIRRYRLAHR